MSPDTLLQALVRAVPLLHEDEPVAEAVPRIVEAQMPALPVVRTDERFYGIFGERELIGALFPGYLHELRSAAFVPRSVDEVIEMRLECRDDPVGRYSNRERITAGPEASDTQVAETFLHHRVLIVPMVDADERVLGVVTRSDFFKALAERFSARS